MRNTLRKLKRNVYEYIYSPFKKISFAQCGEDIIIDFVLFNELGIPKPTYFDIGANDPINLSNTYLFYKKGCRGMLIEPDPSLIPRLISKRPKDICLNIGISNKESIADFYILSSKTLNTFSKDQATLATANPNYGTQKIEDIIKIPIRTIAGILKDYPTFIPNIVSIDVEGLDYEITKSFDFNMLRPEVFCIETAYYDPTKNNPDCKNTEIINFMLQNEYFVYADTYTNTIFVESNKWNKRHLAK